jgi:hypothetical protein
LLKCILVDDGAVAEVLERGLPLPCQIDPKVDTDHRSFCTPFVRMRLASLDWVVLELSWNKAVPNDDLMLFNERKRKQSERVF